MTDQTKVPAGADREKFERIAKDLRNRFLPPRRFTDPPLDGLWLAIADAIERAVAEVASRENVCEEARLNGGLMCCSCRTCCEYFMKTTNLERAEINRLKAELAEAKKADADDYTALCTEATSERSKCECKSCEAARAELERVTGELFTWRKRFNAQPSTYQLAAVERERDTLKTELERVTQEQSEEESGRWQEAIYELLLKFAPDNKVDGAGCDSGDPLDFTLTEIGQALNHIKEERDALKAQLEEACWVLEPFSQVDTELEPDLWDDKQILFAQGSGITVGHCRAARSFLQKVRGQ